MSCLELEKFLGIKGRLELIELKINLSKYHYLLIVCHSLGDKPVLEKSNLSISFNSKIQNLAQFNAKSTEEIYKIIENSAETFSRLD